VCSSDLIEQLLDWLGGVRATARALRLDPASLRWRMKKLGIAWPGPDSGNRNQPA
jgi:hypothetical protein